MTSNNLYNLAAVRSWGSILLGSNIRCDGEGEIDAFDRRVACFSHIHEDHLHGFESAFSQCDAVITSKETKELLIALKGPTWLTKKNNFIALEYGQQYEYKDEIVTLFRSNHILGSAQILVENEQHKKVLYSSDFNVPGAEIVCDVNVLVLDSTHGEPSYNDTAPRQNKINELILRVREEIDELRPVIIRSSRGKMQYLMHLLRNEVKENIPFIAKDDDRRLAEVYGRYGMPSGEIIAAESLDADKIIKKGEPYVRFHLSRALPLPCELQGVRSIRVGNAPEYNIEQTNMFQINLSDHASFGGILDYVAQIDPELVITDNSGRTGGITAITLASEIKNKLQIDAIPMPTTKLMP